MSSSQSFTYLTCVVLITHVSYSFAKSLSNFIYLSYLLMFTIVTHLLFFQSLVSSWFNKYIIYNFCNYFTHLKMLCYLVYPD